MSSEARVYQRFEVNAYVDVTGPDVLLYHRIQNVSLGGICIQSATVADLGQTLEVVINFPDLGAHIAVNGQVVWANREPPQDVGIRWINLDETRRELLRRYVEAVRRRELAPPQTA